MTDGKEAGTVEQRLDRVERDNIALQRIIYRFLLELVRYYERTYGFAPHQKTVN